MYSLFIRQLSSKPEGPEFFFKMSAKFNIFKEFCTSTSLHGYSYLHNVNSIILKFIWAIVILIMTGTAILLSIHNTKDYLRSRLQTNIESSTAPLKVVRSTIVYALKILFIQYIFRMQYFLPLLSVTLIKLKPPL